jgi:hypothetical protein
MRQVSRWKQCTVRLSVIAAAIVLSQIALAQQPASPTGSIPAGWYVYPDDKLKNLDETTLRSFNYSQNEWQVANEGDGINITKLIRRKSGDQTIPSLPPLLKHENGMPGRAASDGLRTAIHYGNGWLLAYDAGEFGGGLWLTNDDGSQTKRILDNNVRAVIPVDNGILVLSGLAHRTMDFGNAFIFSTPNGLDISLQHAMHLDGKPSAPAKAPDGSVFFVTTYGLCRITKTGELQRLIYFPKWAMYQYPNSMAITPDGAIFIGMRMFVLKVRPDAEYSKEWLLPNECRKFELGRLDCVCKP